MEMKAGYKQTEIGIIPVDWNCLKITKFTLSTESSIKIGPFGSSLKKEYLTNNGFKVYGQENVYEKNLGLGDRFIDVNRFRELKSCEILPGDFLISMMGTVGKCMIVPKEIEPGIMDSHLMRLRFDISKTDPQLIAHLFNTKIVNNQIKQLSVGGIMEGLSSKIIKNIYLPLPSSIKEQNEITSLLRDADALIESLEQLIDKKRLIKQGVMQELLRPKENWQELRLGDSATLKARIGWQGLTIKEYLDQGDFYLITGTEFLNGSIDWGNCHYIDEWRYKQDPNIQIREDDVLITKDGTIGKIALIKHIHKPATLNSGVFVARPKGNSFYPDFFYYILSSRVFNEFLNQLSAGSTINHLYQKDFVNFLYKIPPTFDEQVSIAETLLQLDCEIRLLEEKVEKLRFVKQGMMQQLLTGRIRLI